MKTLELTTTRVLVPETITKKLYYGGEDFDKVLDELTEFRKTITDAASPIILNEAHMVNEDGSIQELCYYLDYQRQPTSEEREAKQALVKLSEVLQEQAEQRKKMRKN